jgi:glycosyltransferase involved in cell wall biosynthesis
MQILVLSNSIPTHDRSAGGFRFHSILAILAQHHRVFFHPLDLRGQLARLGADTIAEYRRRVERLGITFTEGGRPALDSYLRRNNFDVVFCEHYDCVTEKVVTAIRYWQPRASLLVDSIDLNYHRLISKGKVSGDLNDRRRAEAVKIEELSAYGQADIVIAISELDKSLLQMEGKDLNVEVISLIYPISPLRASRRDCRRTLLFVADFHHDANVDGIVYFCREILPQIHDRNPDVRLLIVGGSPPEAVRALAADRVEILGYVPDIHAVYETADISIVPMRFGGGLRARSLKRVLQASRRYEQCLSGRLSPVTGSQCHGQRRPHRIHQALSLTCFQ